MTLERFETIAARPEARLDHLALALAAEFRPVDADAALAELDDLGRMLGVERAGSAAEEAAACRRVLGDREGFAGDHENYDSPDNSMLDLVLARRTGLPILLSAVYVEVARRAGIDVRGIGLPGHFAVGHFGVSPPIVLDPFNRGRELAVDDAGDALRAWGAHETALRMLNNLVGSYRRRGDVANAIRAARLRLVLPLGPDLARALELEARRLEATLN